MLFRSAEVAAATVGGQRRYRVRIVGIASREQARQLAVQLEGRFASGKPWIATD